MSNMFVIFDPQGCGGINLLFTSLWLPIFLISSCYWASSSRYTVVLGSGCKSLEFQLRDVMGDLAHPGSGHWAVGTFLFLGFSNFSGLMPYVFTPASHLSMTLSLGLSFWVSYFLYSLVLTPTLNLAHLVPSGTPGVLQPFMVLVESVSTLIRPLTLSVRLAANMVAGHLLISLSSGSVALAGGAMLLFVLESLVALVQAYVFILLSSLYFAESNNSEMS